MKIALAQQNYHIGNFQSNTVLIQKTIEKAKSQEVDLVVFSELAICGYPPHDLLERKEFIEKCIEAIQQVAQTCTDVAALIGGPSINKSNKGKKLFNSAYFLHQGKVQKVFNKTLLPTYDIFDEYRYFEPNNHFEVLEFKDKRLAVTICEDIWDRQPVSNSFSQSRLYQVIPMEKLATQNPDLIINIAASPFSYNQNHNRRQILKDNASRFQMPVVYVNQVGAQTELIFDGDSMVVNSKGEVVLRTTPFEEDFQIITTDEIESRPSLPLEEKEDHIPEIHDALVLGIRDYFKKTGFTKATLGLSGGIDSAVTVVLAVRALGAENVRVLLLPSKYSSDHSITDARDLAENLNIQYDILPIKDIVSAFNDTLTPIFKGLAPDVAEENIQARVRGTLMMALSNKFGHILLNTSNKSESAVGYGTLYGDMNGGLAVLGDVYKTDVFKLAWFINKDKEVIPVNTIVKPPSAELRPDQKDSDSLPEYDILDSILFNFIELNLSPKEIIDLGFNEETVTRTIRMVNNNEYKRFQTPPILRVSSKAFGFGRRIPLVAKY